MRAPLGAGVLALVVLAGGGSYLALHGPGRASAPQPAVTRPAGDGLPVGTGGFDPFRRHARFGWLPDGLVHRSTNVQRGSDGAVVIDAGRPDSNLGARVTVALFPPGVEPHAACLPVLAGWPASLTSVTAAPAPAVGGRAAQWLTVPDPHGDPAGWLRWAYRDGATAVARAEDLSADVMQRIASGLTMTDEPLAFPFAVAGVPASLHPVAAMVLERSKNGWSGALEFASGDSCPSADATAPGSLVIRVDAYVPGIGWGGGASNTTIDGRPADRQTGPGGTESLAVFDVPGPRVALQSGDADTTGRLGKDGLTSLYRRITVLGTLPVPAAAGPPDLTTWTTEPLR